MALLVEGYERYVLLVGVRRRVRRCESFEVSNIN